MRRQLTFCGTRADNVELERRLRQLQPMLVLDSRSLSTDPRVLPSLDVVEQGKQLLSFFLVRIDDLQSVDMQYVPAQRYWSVDELRSPVVQCRLTYMERRLMRAGRLHYVDGFFGKHDEWVEKPEPFRQWAKAVLSTVRKMLQKREDVYIGADAQQWIERNDAVIER